MVKTNKTIKAFREHGGVLRTSSALRMGIRPNDLYSLKNAGAIQELTRGVYQLSEMPPLSEPDLVTVALKVPKGVICLVSALAFHELTSQIPHEVHVALLKGAERPRLAYPPARFYWFSPAPFQEGIEQHTVDRVPVRVYSPEKTIVDCFKFRNRLGLDVFLEALKLYRTRKRRDIDALLRYARIDRVENGIRPYIESVL